MKGEYQTPGSIPCPKSLDHKKCRHLNKPQFGKLNHPEYRAFRDPHFFWGTNDIIVNTIPVQISNGYFACFYITVQFNGLIVFNKEQSTSNLEDVLITFFFLSNAQIQ